MKKLLPLLAGLCLLRGCATVTPEQADAYAAVAHTVVHGGLQDYKAAVGIQNAQSGARK